MLGSARGRGRCDAGRISLRVSQHSRASKAARSAPGSCGSPPTPAPTSCAAARRRPARLARCAAARAPTSRIDVPDPAAGPEAQALRGEQQARDPGGAAALAADQRLAVVMCDIQGFAYEEIADGDAHRRSAPSSRASRGGGRSCAGSWRSREHREVDERHIDRDRAQRTAPHGGVRVNKLLRFVPRDISPTSSALSALLDGQLDAPARSRLEAHVAACDACREPPRRAARGARPRCARCRRPMRRARSACAQADVERAPTPRAAARHRAMRALRLLRRRRGRRVVRRRAGGDLDHAARATASRLQIATYANDGARAAERRGTRRAVDGRSRRSRARRRPAARRRQRGPRLRRRPPRRAAAGAARVRRRSRRRTLGDAAPPPAARTRGTTAAPPAGSPTATQCAAASRRRDAGQRQPTAPAAAPTPSSDDGNNAAARCASSRSSRRSVGARRRRRRSSLESGRGERTS